MKLMNKIKEMSKNRKGQMFQQLAGLAIGVLVFAVIMTVVLLIFSNLNSNTQVSADANASSAMASLTNSTADIVDWVPLLILVSIGVLLLGAVGLFFALRSRR